MGSTSHIYNAKTDRKSFKILKHLQHIDWIETAGELGALLLESQLVKKHMPVFNRKLRRVKQLTGFMVKEIAGYYQLTIAFYNEHEWLDRPEIFGEHSGLGLNIVKNLVELHNGQISAINNKSKGAKVKIIFPEA